MKVFNIMLSRGLGGIEQAFINYAQAIKDKDIEATNILSVGAKVKKSVRDSISLTNLFSKDFLSVIYLKHLIKIKKPEVIIAHGNRAICFARSSLPQCPLIGVAHNYSLKSILKCDYVIAPTNHIKEFLVVNKFNPSRIEIIPNMVTIDRDFVQKPFRSEVVVGVMSRFVEKKGIGIFLNAIALLKAQGKKLRAVIAGDGKLKAHLIDLSKELGLQNTVSFIGWVVDKSKFFDSIDIFCVPSIQEPFGIIILEAAAYSTPIISTRTEGPSEILRNQQDGILCASKSSEALAEKISYLLINPDEAEKYAKSAYVRVKDLYSKRFVSAYTIEFLRRILDSNDTSLKSPF
jgi:glycosyltransferase involved in cell wall biosynthesis